MLGPLAGAILACAASGEANAARATEISGYWQQQQPFLPEVMLAAPPPWNPAAGAQMRAAGMNMASGAAMDFCRPYKFSGYGWGVASDLDIVATPGRVTLISDDIGLVRRVYIGAAAPGPDMTVTNSGTSIGHWDGDTLVVETTGLDPTAAFPLPLPGAPSVGANAKVTERIHLQDKDHLVFEVETTAPDILTAPDRRRWTYRRVVKQIDYALPICTDFDRSVDRATGRQRFDMTPPKDLPPPPPG